MRTWYEVDLVTPNEPKGLRAIFDNKGDAFARYTRHAWLWRRMGEPYILTIHKCWRNERGQESFLELDREDAGLGSMCDEF